MTTPTAPELSVIIPTHNRRDLSVQVPGGARPSNAGSRDIRGDRRRRRLDRRDRGRCRGTLDAVRTPCAPTRKVREARCEERWDRRRRRRCLPIPRRDDVIASPELVAEHVAAHRAGKPIIGIGALVQAPATARDWYAHAFADAWNSHYLDLLSRLHLVRLLRGESVGGPLDGARGRWVRGRFPHRPGHRDRHSSVVPRVRADVHSGCEWRPRRPKEAWSDAQGCAAHGSRFNPADRKAPVDASSPTRGL